MDYERAGFQGAVLGWARKESYSIKYLEDSVIEAIESRCKKLTGNSIREQVKQSVGVLEKIVGTKLELDVTEHLDLVKNDLELSIKRTTLYLVDSNENIKYVIFDDSEYLWS